jgi:hypothetical protein
MLCDAFPIHGAAEGNRKGSAWVVMDDGRKNLTNNEIQFVIYADDTTTYVAKEVLL